MSSELALQKNGEQATNSKTTVQPLEHWCPSCVQFFNLIFTSSRFNLPLNYLTPFEMNSSFTICPMCQFVNAIYGSTAEEQQHQRFAVHIISCLRYYALRSTSPNISFYELEDSDLWVMLPVDRWSSKEKKPSPESSKKKQPSLESVRSTVRDRGCIARLKSKDLPEKKDQYQVHLIDSEIINWGALKGWLSYCARHHRPSCSSSSSKFSSAFVAIDCEDRRTCELPGGAEFLALSYVWGPPTPTTVAPPNTCGVILPEELPLVVEDAITVTKRLGFRYLWVDRYCISDDAVIKHTQIQNMDLVYQSAHATIIATAGEDPSYGLPGVSCRPRRRQPQVRMGSKTLASILPHPGSAIRRSKWASRAWTYQECLLSRRRIFFTDEQVYFECQSMHCCEAFGAPLDALHIPTKDRFRVSMGEGLFQLRGEGQLDIWSRIEEYTQREMTYDSDALNGMLGLLRAFGNKKPMSQIWGLPIFYGLYHEPSGPRRPVDQLIKALCWKLAKKSKRRREFPSWSWTGWKGAVCTRYVGTLLDREFSAAQNLEIYVQDSSNQEVKWQTLVNKPFTPTLRISTDLTIKAPIFRISFYYHPTQYWTPKVLRYRSNEMAECNPFHLCKDTSSDLTFLNRLQTESFTGIVVGDSQDRSIPEYLVLVVDEDGGDGDGAERIGFFVIERAHVMRMSRKTTRIKIQ